MSANMYNASVRNLFCNKERNSDFLDVIRNNEVLKELHIAQILDSGSYFIYTFELDENPDKALTQREALKKIESDWI